MPIEDSPEPTSLDLFGGALAVQALLQRGAKIVFEPDLPRGNRVVRAEWIEELAELASKTLKSRIWIVNAIIRGRLSLRYCVCELDFVITNSEFENDVDLSFCRFRREVNFERSTFLRTFKFTGADTYGDLEISEATFADAVEFRALSIGKAIQARGTQFVKADFEGAVVQGDLIFISSVKGQPTCFRGYTTFIGAKVTGQADFSSSQFSSEARFDLMQVDGGVFFRRDEPRDFLPVRPPSDAERDYPAVSFRADATFVDAHFSAQADFTGVQFSGIASFDGMVVEGDAQFGKDEISGPVVFAAEARFPAVVVKGQANFTGAVFTGPVLFRHARVLEEFLLSDASFRQTATFDHVKFEGPAFFRARDGQLPTRFNADVTFRGATFSGTAHLGGITFGGQVNFDGACFQAEADFRHSVFSANAVFAGISASRDLCFQGALFKADLSFEEASCRALFFRDQMINDVKTVQAQFYGSINLVGLCYERVYACWHELLQHLDPFDRHPYGQLERSLRAIGDDISAGEVYYLQRKRMMRQNWSTFRRNWWRALCDTAYYGLARFGVRPVRLFVTAIVLLLASAGILSRPGAVEPKRDSGLSPRQLTWVEGLGVATSLFLPVEVPIGAAWRPTDQPISKKWLMVGSLPVTFAFWSTVLRLGEWIIVPLGLATVTGILQRRSKQ